MVTDSFISKLEYYKQELKKKEQILEKAQNYMITNIDN